MKKHSLVIGGTRGLGREVVRLFVGDQHLVSVIGRKAPAATDQQLDDVSFWSTDVAQAEVLKPLLEKIVQANGKLTNLVLLQRFKGEGDKWSGEIETSLTAANNTIETLAGSFVSTGEASIVIVSSIADTFVSESQPAGYHAAKAGLLHLVHYFAVKLGPKGIRVNCVSPSTLIKEENKDFYEQNQDLQGLFKKIIPLGRMGTARDSANVIAFLCSAQASFLTGQCIVVDGGVSLLSQEALARKVAGV